jgi:hypothetical protein
MVAPPQRIIPPDNSDLLPALRGLFSQRPAAMQSGLETLARLLWVLSYLPYRPEESEVEIAMEALRVEGEVLL